MKQVGNRFKKIGAVAMSIAMIMSTMALTSCGSNSSSDNTISMYVGLGNTNSGYYEKLRDAIEKETGVKIQLVSSNTMDTTNSMVSKIQNNDLPSDIVITASKTDNKYCKKSLLDLAAYTNLPDSFNSAKIMSFATAGGNVYQLPYTTRLIGIEYNKTLFDEMGWELPKTFNEMVALKAKAESAGIKFAVSGGAATGHGFNYLFNTMGTDYLIKPTGTEWLNSFLEGGTDVSSFAQASSYFQKFKEAGLFGDIHDEDWLASKQFCEERALIYFNYINDCYSYDGYQYNEDGTIVGAKYSSDGKPVAEKKKDGEAVLIDGEYVFYDENNEEHKGLDRYTIPGAVILHDKYGSMPWISEDGNTNCYVEYNSMFVGLNAELGEKGNEEKLQSAIDVMTFMLSEKATDIFSETFPDGIVLTKDYVIKKDRLYYEYSEPITKGYRMPWYYNSFDVDSITNVGALVNSYLQGDPSVSMNTIMKEIEYRNNERLKGNTEVLAEIEETIDYEESAKLQANANRIAADAALAESGNEGEVEVALMAYIEEPSDISKEGSLPVVQEKFYKGKLEKSKLSSHINPLTNDVSIVRMKGSEINEILKNGFDASEDFGYEHVFNVLAVTKDDKDINKQKEYLVAVPEKILGEKKFAEYQKAGKVIMDGEEALKATTIDGINIFLKDKDTLSVDDLTWK